MCLGMRTFPRRDPLIVDYWVPKMALTTLLPSQMGTASIAGTAGPLGIVRNPQAPDAAD
jgi:hypothetical protein